MTTTAASLAGIGRIYFNERSATPLWGVFRFTGQHAKETRPGRVTDIFSKAVIMQHPVDVQIFHHNKAELVDHLPVVLVGKVSSTPTDTFMDAGYNLTFSLALRRTLFGFRKVFLGCGKSLFFFSKETGIFNLLTVRKGSKGFKANVNTNLSGVSRNTCGSTPSQLKQTYHLPVVLRVSVAVLGLPLIGRWSLTLTWPTLLTTRMSPSNLMPEGA